MSQHLRAASWPVDTFTLPILTVKQPFGVFLSQSHAEKLYYIKVSESPSQSLVFVTISSLPFSINKSVRNV